MSINKRKIYNVKESSLASRLFSFTGVAIIFLSTCLGGMALSADPVMGAVIGVIIGTIISLPLFALVSITEDIHAIAWNSSIIAEVAAQNKKPSKYKLKNSKIETHRYNINQQEDNLSIPKHLSRRRVIPKE